MLARIVPGAVALSAVALLAVGCGQSKPTTAQTASDAPKPAAGSQAEPASQAAPTDENAVTQATAQSPLGRGDDKVAPAVAAAPVEKARQIVAAPNSSSAGEPGPLPLEEPIDSGMTLPQVYLTEAHAKTCLVKVGDVFPKLDLPDLGGQPQSFGAVQGAKLTIVVFWNAKLPTALQELADLQSRFLREFGEQGVAVVGVNVRDDAKLAAEVAKQAGAEFTILSDADGAAFAKVATTKLPRTYLIDPSGKIRWFDLEYSRTTRQQLLSALRFALKTEAPK
jgi:peroxiredoxin